MGEPVTMTRVEDNQTFNVGRYGVWQDGNVIDTSDDLEALQTEHGPNLRVIPVRGSGPPPHE